MKQTFPKALISSLFIVSNYALAAVCDSTSLAGAYSYNYTSFVPPGTSCAGVGIARYNGGVGSVSGVDSCNGVAVSIAGQGAYFVRKNCTGEATVTFNNGATGKYYFTVVNNGQQFGFIITTPGVTGQGFGTKQP